MESEPPSPEIVAGGSSGIILEHGDDEVLKWFNLDNAREFEIEERIYKRLGHHDRIVEVRDYSKKGIIMKRMTEPLCLRLQDLQQKNELPSSQAIWKWSTQIAEGLQYIHSKGILQADISSANILLDENNDIKYCDFAGSSIDNEKALVYSGTHYSLPNNWDHHPSIQDEVFAIGCILYELSTCHKPYDQKTHSEIETLYKEARFPEIEHLILGPVITKCWNMQYYDMDEVLQHLKKLHQNAKCQQISYFVLLSLIAGIFCSTETRLLDRFIR